MKKGDEVLEAVLKKYGPGVTKLPDFSNPKAFAKWEAGIIEECRSEIEYWDQVEQASRASAKDLWTW